MVRQNSNNQDYTNNADGFALGGGATKRKLTLTGGDVTLTGSGSSTHTFPSASDTLVGRNSTDTLTNKNLTSGTNTFPVFPVTNGGTGRATSTTAYGIIAAGTTDTGAQQTITPGTSGQFLKSAGGSALAAFASIQLSDLSDSSSIVTVASPQTLSGKQYQLGLAQLNGYTVLNASYIDKLLEFTGTSNNAWVLPSATTYGQRLLIANTSNYRLRLDRAGSDQIYAAGGLSTTYLVAPGGSVELVSDGTNWAATSDGGTLVDSQFALVDNSDLTKRAQFEISGVATDTTRTLTVPDASTTLVGTDVAQTLTGKNISADTNTITDIEVDNFKASAIIIASEGIASNDNDTTLPTSAAVKAYVDTTTIPLNMPNLITNPDFTSDLTGWATTTQNSSWAWGAGKAVLTLTEDGYSTISSSSFTLAGEQSFVVRLGSLEVSDGFNILDRGFIVQRWDGSSWQSFAAQNGNVNQSGATVTAYDVPYSSQFRVQIYIDSTDPNEWNMNTYPYTVSVDSAYVQVADIDASRLVNISSTNMVFKNKTMSGTYNTFSNIPINALSDSTSASLGVGSIDLGHATDTTISRFAAGKIAVENVELPTVSSTSTLTNKRVNPRVVSPTVASSYTINVDVTDLYNVSGQSSDVTFNNPTGTPVNGQKMMVRIKDNGTARTVGWGSNFQASGITGPIAQTVPNKEHNVLFVYSAGVSKWVCLAADTVGY